MKQEVLHDNLLNAIRTKVPHEENLASVLGNILCIGKEAIYRRLRGDVPFTLLETALISKEMNISVDSLLESVSPKSRPFQLKLTEFFNPLETDFLMMENYVDVFRTLDEKTYSESASSTNILPQPLYQDYKFLSRFYLFKWKAQRDGLDSVKTLHEIVPEERLVRIQKDLVVEARRVKDTSYIFDNMIFLYLINDIKYFASVNLISNADVQELKEELFHFLNCLERLAAKGRFDNGNRIHFYISNINFDTTYSYVHTQKYNLSLIKAFTLNGIASLDDKTFESVKSWILSLKRFSTLISESGDLQRIHFFKSQRELVATL
ncbi:MULTISPECIES: helix-turn-helix domain-containing protein [Butyricimonas]|uniref:Transcription regulator BetR N-terminal domain-containing protein n=1 Tax=Butyricimonas hominis TaxID=2763032 RepID=A0ABR7D0S0_9BACT|nr:MULTISPECIES: helix-turn-helix domain-containing protein [Butyricimonas]MBC5621527.1 hypothetical protein [Butyricimonas hominis]MCB6972966.1 hypothetical protein [Butyricimonas synergistica]MCG4518502.1 hypothetical protein [Butyricimonas sp. DFI.6.44]